jgi:hypothetical protein
MALWRLLPRYSATWELILNTRCAIWIGTSGVYVRAWRSTPRRFVIGVKTIRNNSLGERTINSPELNCRYSVVKAKPFRRYEKNEDTLDSVRIIQVVEAIETTVSISFAFGPVLEIL